MPRGYPAPPTEPIYLAGDRLPPDRNGKTTRQRPDPDILTLFEAAQFLRVNERTLRELATRGEVPGAKVGKCWRFSQAKLTELIRGEGKPAGPSQGEEKPRR